MSEIATLALSGVVGAVTGFLAAFLKSALEERVKVDAELRGVRTPLYQEIWRRMALVPRWPRNDTLTYAELRAFSEWLRDWYFDGGGLYLSRESRERYGDLQDALQEVAEKDGQVTSGDRNADYERVQRACSALRGAMTDDLLSRRGRAAIFASLPGRSSLRSRRP